MTTQNYYEILGLAPFAEGAMVDQAYWHLARTYQGLAEADPRARQALDDLNEAYAVLGTPRLREEYDARIAGPAMSRAGASKSGTAETTAARFRFALPKWPFARTEQAKPVIEARVRALNPAVAQADVTAPVAPARPDPAPPTRQRAGKGDVVDLHASTARMLERWRASADAAASQSTPSIDEAPDMTLVDIFKTEKHLESKDDPLSAVMEILKAPPDRVPATSDPGKS